MSPHASALIPTLQMLCFEWLDAGGKRSQPPLAVFRHPKAAPETHFAQPVAEPSSSASTGAVAAAQKASDGTAVAIDSKIEQAMDLVKTHLIYAVRDEMEVLRSRIVHLEATLAQLEAENAVLREHIPREVLDSLPPLDPTTNGHQQTAKQSSLQPMASAPATAVQ